MKPTIRPPGKKLSPQKLTAFEQEHHLQLSAAYREFLLENNGGDPRPDTFCYKGKKTPSGVCRGFYGIDTGQTFDDLADMMETYCTEGERRVPKRLVPIAWDAFGNLICLSIKGKDTGAVYFWDHENEDSKPGPAGDVSDDNVSLIADSFEAFLDQFTESREEKAAKKKRKPWYEAIANGDIEAVKTWLNGGGNVNEPDGNFVTPIVAAILERQLEVADLLLDRGVSHNMALMYAVNSHEWRLVGNILTHFRNRQMKFGDTMEENALFQLTLDSCNDPEVIRLFLDFGAPLNKKLRRGPALYHATEDVAHPEIVRLLLERGAKPGVWGHSGRLPLTNALYIGKMEAAKLLMDAGENLYFQPPPEFPGWAKALPDYKPPRDFKPVEMLDASKKTKAIKTEVLAYAAKLGQTPDFDGPLVKR